MATHWRQSTMAWGAQRPTKKWNGNDRVIVAFFQSVTVAECVGWRWPWWMRMMCWRRLKIPPEVIAAVQLTP